MSFITWSLKYEFGIPEMDQQHRFWIELVNHMYKEFKEQNDKDLVHAMFNTAIDYIHYHFSEEERMMQIIGYSALREQQKEHAEIGAVVEHLRKDIRSGNIIISQHIINKLRILFAQHILFEDKKYVEQYKRAKTMSMKMVSGLGFDF
jgi:hemerythrin-like metal-binding domain